MKTFTAGQDVWVRGCGHLAWMPARYVRYIVEMRRHVVEMPVSQFQRRVPDGRIRATKP